MPIWPARAAGKNFAPDGSSPNFVPRTRSDLATIVYSSGTGGRPKGCMMTHENYLEQCVALTSLYPFAPGIRYLSILPTNHAIDFMVGFFGPFICGAAVVHLRTLRPGICPRSIHEIQNHLREPGAAGAQESAERACRRDSTSCPPGKRRVFNTLVAVNKALTKSSPTWVSAALLLKQVHEDFGGELRAIIVGGAFTEPQTLQFFYDLGIPVANGYGLTEAGMAITVNDLKPFRADTVGKPLPGMEVRIVNPDARRHRRSSRAQQNRDVRISRRAGTDCGNHRRRLVDDRRPRALRSPPATCSFSGARKT